MCDPNCEGCGSEDVLETQANMTRCVCVCVCVCDPNCEGCGDEDVLETQANMTRCVCVSVCVCVIPTVRDVGMRMCWRRRPI